MSGNGPPLNTRFILDLDQNSQSIQTSGLLTRKYCVADHSRHQVHKFETAIEIISSHMKEFLFQDFAVLGIFFNNTRQYCLLGSTKFLTIWSPEVLTKLFSLTSEYL